MTADNDTTHTEETLLEFPCHFPIKVMGKACDELSIEVDTIIDRHVNMSDRVSVKQNHSSSGNYISITVTINAQSRQQLDAIYMDLTRHEMVIMAL